MIIGMTQQHPLVSYAFIRAQSGGLCVRAYMGQEHRFKAHQRGSVNARLIIATIFVSITGSKRCHHSPSTNTAVVPLIYEEGGIRNRD